MKFNEISLNLFNNSSSYLNLLVFEESNNENIFDSKDMKNIIGKLADINYKIVTVENILNIKTEYYYKINYKNRIKGYFKPKGSVLILPKSKQQIKLTNHLNFDNELNSHLNLDKYLFESVNNKIVHSSSFTIFNNLLYEMILYKNEIVGFFPCFELEYLVRQSELFHISKETSIYQDSSLKKKINTIKKTSIEYRSEYIIPTRNLLRFKYQNTNAWVPINSTDLEYSNSNYTPKNISEALIQSIMYQYEDKLNKTHHYHLKIINKELNNMKGDHNKN